MSWEKTVQNSFDEKEEKQKQRGVLSVTELKKQHSRVESRVSEPPPLREGSCYPHVRSETSITIYLIRAHSEWHFPLSGQTACPCVDVYPLFRPGLMPPATLLNRMWLLSLGQWPGCSSVLQRWARARQEIGSIGLGLKSYGQKLTCPSEMRADWPLWSLRHLETLREVAHCHNVKDAAAWTITCESDHRRCDALEICQTRLSN